MFEAVDCKNYFGNGVKTEWSNHDIPLFEKFFSYLERNTIAWLMNSNLVKKNK